jgi:hypothetical protein
MSLTKTYFCKKSLEVSKQKLVKIFFNSNLLIYTLVDAVCNGEYEFDIILQEKCDEKRQNRRIGTPLGMTMSSILNFSLFYRNF